MNALRVPGARPKAAVLGKGSPVLLVLLALCALYLALVWLRPVDGDEGLYVTAFDEVAAGRSLYTDVLYFQFPGLPYLFAPWLRFVSGPSPAGVRVLSFLFSAATLGIVALYAYRERLSRRATAALVLVVGASGLMVGWASTIKTYPFCIFCSVVAFLALSATRQSRYASIVWPALAGLALGAASAARFFYLACMVAALLWMAWDGASRGLGRQAARAVLAFLAGGIVVLLPVVWAVTRDPDAFWFCTVTFHGYRNEHSAMIGDWKQKLDTVWSLFCHLQLAALALLAVWTLRGKRLLLPEHRDQALAVAWIAMLSVLQFLPTPTLTQYYVNIVPLLAFAGAKTLSELVDTRWRASCLGLAAYLAFCPFESFWLEIKPMAGGWCPYTIAEWNHLARTIESHTAPNDRVLAWWPGIVTTGHRRLVHGFENNFPYMAWKRLPPAVRERYGVPDSQTVTSAIVAADPALVLLRRRFFFPDRETYEVQLQAKYELIAEESDFLVYARR